ncbi:YybH family protein [Streptomyces sp. NPDC014734]|uniref:YybH family protein n=1 Tax=Streptomyces sp. NPDC014734 TaxID=3364886 RepID=UPI0036F6D08D
MNDTGVTAHLEGLIRDRVAAVGAKDVAALAARYADDVVLFDAVGPLSDRGVDVEIRRLENWFGAYRTGIGLEIRELEVAAADGFAFGHYLFQVRGTMNDGTAVSMWVRSTVCFREHEDGWKIVHEHSSVPFDGTTGRALVGLRP